MKSYFILITSIGLCVEGYAQSRLKANDDSQNGNFNTQVTVQVLNNDIDSTGGTANLLTVTKPIISLRPAHGQLFVNEDGSITYDPDCGYIGKDEFQYRIFNINRPNDLNISSVGKVTIVIKRAPSVLLNYLEKNVTIRRSHEDANLKNKPAEFAFFHPLSGTNEQGNNDYFQLNGSLNLNLPWGSDVRATTAHVTYNRNSGLKDPQNSLAIGLNEDFVTNESFKSFSASYRRDYQMKSKSAQAIFLYTPFFNFLGDYHPNNYFYIGKRPFAAFSSQMDSSKCLYQLPKVFYSVSFGAEYENRFFVEDAKLSQVGDYVRPVFKSLIKFYPWYINDRFNIFANYDIRYDILRPVTTDGSKYHPLLEVGFEYDFISGDKSKFSFGISYKNGDNPIVGLMKNEYLSSTLRVQIY